MSKFSAKLNRKLAQKLSRRHNHGLETTGEAPKTRWSGYRSQDGDEKLSPQQLNEKRKRVPPRTILKTKPVVGPVAPERPDQPILHCLFTMRFDPYSGKWQFVTKRGDKKYWSRPLTLYEIEKMAKRQADAELVARHRAGDSLTGKKQTSMSGLDIQRLIDLGVFKVNTMPVTSPYLKEARAAQRAQLARAEELRKETEVDDLFNELF